MKKVTFVLFLLAAAILAVSTSGCAGCTVFMTDEEWLAHSATLEPMLNEATIDAKTTLEAATEAPPTPAPVSTEKVEEAVMPAPPEALPEKLGEEAGDEDLAAWLLGLPEEERDEVFGKLLPKLSDAEKEEFFAWLKEIGIEPPTAEQQAWFESMGGVPKPENSKESVVEQFPEKYYNVVTIPNVDETGYKAYQQQLLDAGWEQTKDSTLDDGRKISDFKKGDEVLLLGCDPAKNEMVVQRVLPPEGGVYIPGGRGWSEVMHPSVPVPPGGRMNSRKQSGGMYSITLGQIMPVSFEEYLTAFENGDWEKYETPEKIGWFYGGEEDKPQKMFDQMNAALEEVHYFKSAESMVELAYGANILIITCLLP